MEQSYNWILKCIASCKNGWQLDCCRELIKLFMDKYASPSNIVQYNKMVGNLVEALHNQNVFQSVEV